jgi:hypothetical protein
MDYQFNFSTWSDFVNHANYDEEKENEALKALGYDRSCRSGRTIRHEFQHVKSWDEVMRLATAGWPEGLKESQALSETVERKLTGQVERESISYQVVGELLDIGRYCAGEPEHWGVFETTIVEGQGNKLAHVVVNGTASGRVDKSVLIRRGAMVAAFIKLMELAGYRVKVTLAYKTGTRGVSCTIKTVLKDFDTTLDQDMLAFALVHPATFRCLGFCVLDSAKDTSVQEMLGSSYGIPLDLDMAEQGDVYLGMMMGGESTWESAKSAEQWVIDELKRYQVLA